MRKYIKFEIPVIVETEDQELLVPTQNILEFCSEQIDNANLLYYADKNIRNRVKGYKTEIKNNKLFVVLEFTNKESQRFINKAINYFDGQFSDGWGEGFEQEPRNVDDIPVYISLWKRDFEREII